MSEPLSNFVAGEVTQWATGFQFTEGPQWHPDGYFLFVDIRTSRTYRIRSGGQPEIARENTGGGNGITFDLQGNVVQCEMEAKRMVRVRPDGAVEVIADNFEGKRFNAPNDVVCAPDGSIYFTDPALRVPWGDRELPTAVYRIAPDGALSQFAEAEFPNGLTVGLDGKTLLVNNTRTLAYIQSFPINADGTAGQRRLLIEVYGDQPGAPDGMKLDTEGRIYCTGPGGVWIISPDGRHLATIACAEQPANLAFGGPDLRTLFFTARTSVYAVPMKVSGQPHPWLALRG